MPPLGGTTYENPPWTPMETGLQGETPEEPASPREPSVGLMRTEKIGGEGS